MKVDLAALRKLIEEEIGRIEQKKTELKQQLQHISAVEQIAEEAESELRVADQSEEPDSDETKLSKQSRRWFQQV